jgi:hypothetical protein
MNQGTKDMIANIKPRKRVKVGVWLPRLLDREIEVMAFHLDQPKRQVIEDALRAYLVSNPLPKEPVV